MNIEGPHTTVIKDKSENATAKHEPFQTQLSTFNQWALVGTSCRFRLFNSFVSSEFKREI